MPDGTGYPIVPGALREMTFELSTAARRWKTMIAKVDEMKLGADDLGVLANAAEYVTGYNEANEVIVDRLDEVTGVLDATATTINDVATNYEMRSAEWYEEFGYINRKT
ncbi:hypothetical protein [Actinophytocola sediminis]